MRVVTLALTVLLPLTLSHPSGLAVRQAEEQLGPCDPWSEQCLAVRQADTCFAAYLPFNTTGFSRPGGNKTEMLRCVDSQNETQALTDVSFWSRK